MVTDVICKLENKDIISVEVNSRYSEFNKLKGLMYLTRIISEGIKVSGNYLKISKYIQVNLNMGGVKDYPIIEYCLQNKESGIKFTDRLRIIDVDISYFSASWYYKSYKELTELEKYLGIIGIQEKKYLRKITDELLKEIGEVFMKYSEDEELVYAYDLDELKEAERNFEIEESYNNGVENGIDFGKKEKSKEIVKSMLNDNLDINVISKYTNLSENEIKTIKKEIQ